MEYQGCGKAYFTDEELEEFAREDERLEALQEGNVIYFDFRRGNDH